MRGSSTGCVAKEKGAHLERLFKFQSVSRMYVIEITLVYKGDPMLLER